jgi:hypothetical protein
MSRKPVDQVEDLLCISIQLSLCRPSGLPQDCFALAIEELGSKPHGIKAHTLGFTLGTWLRVYTTRTVLMGMPALDVASLNLPLVNRSLRLCRSICGPGHVGCKEAHVSGRREPVGRQEASSDKELSAMMKPADLE